jgi:hypothetical protein
MSETDYQEKAADELKKKVELAIESGKLKEIALKACVGSGKEVIASLAVKKLMKAEKAPLFFVWLVVGGDFRAQNAKKEVEDLLGDDAQTVEYGSDIRDSIVRAAFPGTVAFSSFESFIKEETSSPLSGIKAMGGAKTIVIIDESVSEISDAERNFMLGLPTPSAVVRLATDFKSELSSDGVVSVRTLDAINEGTIRHATVINQGLSKGKSYPEKTDCILAALSERDELAKLYKEEKSKVNPLCIILSDSNGITKAAEIAQSSGARTSLITDGSSEQEIREIQKKQSGISAIVSDAASLSGVPIPRAQILCDIRSGETAQFDLRSIAMVSRTAERRKYVNDKLNTAYVFTTASTAAVSLPDQTTSQREASIPTLVPSAAENVIGGMASIDKALYKGKLTLPSFWREPEPSRDIGDSFAENIEFMLGKYWDMKLFSLADDSVKASLIGKERFGSEFAATSKEKENAFDEAIMSGLGRYATERSLSVAKKAIFSFFRNRLHCDDAIAVACILNLKASGEEGLSASSFIASAVADYDSGKLDFFLFIAGEPFAFRDWQPPMKQSVYLFNEPCGSFSKSLYKPLFANLSSWKRDFMEFMEKERSVSWFMLNRPLEDSESFLIFYDDDVNDEADTLYDYWNDSFVDSKAKGFAPDFVVRLSDGRTLIVDVKRPDDRSDPTCLKELGLASYGAFMRANGRPDVVCAVASEKDGKVWLSNGLGYAPLNSGKGGWKEWSDYLAEAKGK